MTQTTIMQARCVATICAVEDRWIRVKETPIRVNNSIGTWRRLNAGQNLVGKQVRLKVRQLVLDPGSDDERWVWDARVIGDLL